MKFVMLALMFVVLIGTNSVFAAHPGLLLTQAQLERAKTRYANQESPYYASCRSVINRASNTIRLFKMNNPVRDMSFGWSGSNDGIDNSLADFRDAVTNDMTTASANVYKWILTGDIVAAQKAVSIFEDWAGEATIVDMYDFNIDFANATFDGMTNDGYNGVRPWNFALDMGWTSYGLRAAADAYILLKENGYPLTAQQIQQIESVIRKLVATTDSSLDAWGEWARFHQGSSTHNRYVSDNHIPQYLSAIGAAAAALNDEALFKYVVDGDAYDFGKGNNNENYVPLKKYLEEALILEPNTTRVVWEDYSWKTNYRTYHGMVQLSLGTLFRVLDMYYASAAGMYEGYTNKQGFTAMDAAKTYAGYLIGQYGGGSGDSLSGQRSLQVGLEYAFATTNSPSLKNLFREALLTSLSNSIPRQQDFKEYSTAVCFIGEELDTTLKAPPMPPSNLQVR